MKSALTKKPKTVETLASDLEALRLEETEALQKLGVCEMDRLDTTDAEAVLHQVEGRIRVVEAALTVARQKDEAEQADRKQAEQHVAIEADVEVTALLKTVFVKVDHVVRNLECLFVDEVGPAMKAARDILSKSGIRDGELYFLTEVPGVIKQHLLLAVHTVIGEGFVPVNSRKYARVSDVVPDENFIRSRERAGPSTAKPIPGWKIGD